MYYQINVSQNGKHYFATAEHSLRNENTALDMADHFRELFPKSEGYEIRITRHAHTIQEVA